MVSPSLFRSRPGADDIEESNSTANLFLGGVRRNWMSGPKNAPASGPQTRPSQPDPKPAAPSSTQTESVRSGPAEAALISPVTPGSTSPPAAPPHDSQVTVANKSDPPPATLPSPVPSRGSHPSPVVSDNIPASTPDAGPQASPGPAVSAQPTDSHTATLPRPSSRPGTGQDQRQNTTGTTAVRSPGQTNSEPTQKPLHVATNGDQVQSSVMEHGLYRDLPAASAEHSHAQVSSPTERRPSQLGELRPHAQSSGSILPNEGIWNQWRASLEQLKREARMSPSNITRPRIMLLEDAVQYRDLLYLVLHQIYCRRTIDDRILVEFPVLQQDYCLKGMDRLNDLLENNAKIPEQTVRSFADFPSKLEGLRHEAWFYPKIQEMSQCLYRLGARLFGMRDHFLGSLYHRGYPPLVEELSTEFQVASPVLMSVIFASTCRHLYDDDQLPTLNKLFRRDLLITARLLEAHYSSQQMPQHLVTLVEEYKKIPMRPKPGPLLQRSPRPAPLGFQTQAVSMHVTGPPSIGNQSSVASPMVSAYANPNSASNSPRGMMAQTPGYFQQHHHPLPSQQQTQPTQRGQTIPSYPSQMGTSYAQVPVGHVLLSQGQTPLPTPMQSVPRRLSQPSYPGQTAQLAHSGQAQRALQAQRQTGIPYATSPSVPSPPLGHWPAQVMQQPGPQPSDVPPVNFSNQRRASQRPPLYSPRSQLGAQPTISPREAPSPATQGSNALNPQHLVTTPLLPPAGYRAPQMAQPAPMRLGLHLADLRDPVKKLIKLGPHGESIETELYHFQGDFLLTPQSIDPSVLCYNWNFSLSEDEYQRFPLLHQPGQGQRPIRTFQSGCRTFRLRSITLRDFEEEASERLWPTKSTTWPSVFYVLVNGVEMFVRRKVHNGKDLPLDITKYLKPGDNKVTVHFLLGTNECKDFRYAFGIERMVTTIFEHVRGVVGTTAADETRQVIRNRLTPSVDDDFAFITDNLTINLIDPFTAQIFKTPARSIYCTHLECFDLDTFIGTRKSESGPTPLNDNWRCPICHADARPPCLRVDTFLVGVRDELICTQRLEVAQAIQVKADGTWALKVVRDDSPPSPPVNRSTASIMGKRKADGMIDSGSPASRTKTEGSPDRNPPAHTQEPLVIELD